MRIPLLLLALLLATTASGRAETLVFAPLPQENPETVTKHWKPLLDYLEATLDIKVKIERSATNEEVADKFIAGRVDLAYLGPLPYVFLKEKAPHAEPLVLFLEKDGTATYTCAIVASVDNELRLDQMSGQTIALTSPTSTCGYVAVDGLLQRHGLSLQKNRFRYLNQHDEVALAVVRGDFDAGGLKTVIARKYSHLGLEVIAETGSFPGFALVANSRKVSAARMAQLAQALLEADAATRAHWGYNIGNGVRHATDQDYDSVRGFVNDGDIPQQGNF